jgi:conjugal transfer pilin signal peptidase TrbI
MILQEGTAMRRLDRFVNKKESWGRFTIKMALTTALIIGSGAMFFSRFTFAYDPQQVISIKGYSFYLIDRGDKGMEKGKLYAFHPKVIPGIYTPEHRLVKYLRGVPSDRVEINLKEQVKVNDEVVAVGLVHADKIGRPRSSFVGKGTLGPNAYWFMGDAPLSFDSRYWGTVTKEQIIGRSYPLF